MRKSFWEERATSFEELGAWRGVPETAGHVGLALQRETG